MGCSTRQHACCRGHWSGRTLWVPCWCQVQLGRSNYHKVRRLHLIVVDLWRPWKYKLSGPERLLTNFGAFLIMMTHVGWALSGQRALQPTKVPSICVWLCSGWLWMPLLPGVAAKYWIPPQLTRLFWINPSFAPWACSFSMTPSHLHLKFASAGMLWLFLAWMKTSFNLTCTLLEQECCVLDLALTKNIDSTMKQGQQTEQKSLRRSSSWLPMRWIPSLTRLSPKRVPVTLKALKVRAFRAEWPSFFAGFWCWTIWTYASFLGGSRPGLSWPRRSYWVWVQQAPETWACSWAMAPGEAILLLAKMCWPPWPSLGWVLLGGPCNTGWPHRIATFPSPSG